MSLDRIYRSSIWINTLSPIENDPYEKERGLLRQNFISFREKAEAIVSQISKAVPELTIHDISHLDALWETASVICGDKYPLNPLEAFILGGAFLLHDAALSFEAYEKGLAGVRNTTVWGDIYASASKMSDEAARLQLADFTALRALHAEQSAKLALRSWSFPDNDSHVYLIDHPVLRNHLGELIGKIAASHHWDMDKVQALSHQMNSIQGFPKEWRINPMKLACIIRCADAAHISADRAPDFLYALLKRSGISFQHWQSQNRLAGPDIDTSDESGATMIYTSTRPFNEDEAGSWWIAYDLITLIDQEIKSCNELIENHINKETTFKIKLVKGAQSVNLLKRYVQVANWDPINSKIHVSNIQNLISNLGGQQLYGSSDDLQKFEIVLRELMQNARDSIIARTQFDKDFVGKILVKIERQDNAHILTVEDNGLGMTQRVLTGPLLDFGTSFWTSSLVHSEFPGLASSDFKSVGRYGIGFYSVFMVADKVQVATKSWRQGIDSTMQLLFNDGLSLRPLFKPSAPTGFKTSVNCQIRLTLKSGILSDGLIFQTTDSHVDKIIFDVPMEDYLARLCAALDVDLYYSEGGRERKIHTNIVSPEFDIKSWLHKISFSGLQPDQRAYDLIENDFSKLQVVVPNDPLSGIAAIHINSGANFIGVNTVGGFCLNPLNRGSQRYLGFLASEPKSARRDAGEHKASIEMLKEWATHQINLIGISKLEISSLATLADIACSYEIDPTPFAIVIVKFPADYFQFSIDQLADILIHRPLVIFMAYDYNFVEIQGIPDNYEEFLILRPMSMGEFYRYNFKDGLPDKKMNFFFLLHRALLAKGQKPVWTTKKTNIRSPVYQTLLDAVMVRVENI